MTGRVLVILRCLADELEGLVGDVFVAAAAFEPVHVRFAAEPGELALGVVAVALLGLGDGLLAGEFVFEDGGGFGVAERGEGAAVFAVAGDEAFGLFDEAAVEHGGGALVDAFVETCAWRVEAEAQDAIAGEGVAALLPLLGERFFCGEGDFDGADYFGDVVDVDGCGCGWVEAGEEAMEVGGAAGLGEFAEAFALAGFLGRGGEEAVDERAQVEAGAAGDDGQVAPFGDASEGFAGLAAVVACGAGFVGPGDVDHVVLDEGALFARGLGGADLHLAVDGDGVAADDLAVELFGEAECERGFAAGGGADEDDERFGVQRGHHGDGPASPQTPPTGREDVVDACAEQAEEKDRKGKEEQAAYLASAFGLPASCCRSGLLWHGFEKWPAVMFDVQLLDDFETELRKRLVGEEVDAEFEVRALEVCGQGGELPDAGDAAPAGAVDGGVLAGAVEVHGGDVTVGADGEADEGFALLVEGWTGLLGDEGDPVALDVSENSPDVGAEVDALRVGENLGLRRPCLDVRRRERSGRNLRSRGRGLRPGRLCGWRRRRFDSGCRSSAGWVRWPGRFDQGLLGRRRSGRRRLGSWWSRAQSVRGRVGPALGRGLRPCASPATAAASFGRAAGCGFSAGLPWALA